MRARTPVSSKIRRNSEQAEEEEEEEKATRCRLEKDNFHLRRTKNAGALGTCSREF
jgi:hypothetical protein